MTPKNPFLEGTFWEKFWRPIRSRALLFTLGGGRSESLLRKPGFNKLKTTPTPNKKGSDVRKGGGGSYAIFWGPYAIFSVEIP